MDARQIQLRGRENVLIVIMAVMALGALAAWLLAHGFMFDDAMVRWSKVLGVLGSEHIRLENLSLLYPHLPLYAMVPFYYLPGMKFAGAPYLVSVLFAAILIWLFLHHMRAQPISIFKRMLLLVLLVLHPAFLWGATNGSQLAMSMVMFYLLYHACQSMIAEHDIHAYISLALILAMFFFIDGSAVFIFVALLPMLAVVAPRRLMMVSPLSIYFILSVPFLMAVFSWAWLNWLFASDFFHFIHDPHSSYLGGYMTLFNYPWLVHYGGHFFATLLPALGYALAAYPAAFYFLFATWQDQSRFRASFVLFVHPVLAIALATDQFYLRHPIEILVLISASIFAELTFIDLSHTRSYWRVVAMLVISLAGGWWVFTSTANPAMQQWLQAFRADRVLIADQDGALRLGRWLATHRLPTMIDENSAYKVLVARGDAKGLYLSYTDRFKLALGRAIPDIDQIVVADPTSPAGKLDHISIHYPNLYAHGMPGFRLVYSGVTWRVYRRL